MNMDTDTRSDQATGNENPLKDEFLELLEASFDYTPLERGDIRQAVILQVRPNEILVDVGAKRDGIVPIQDLERMDDKMRESLHVGQEVPVYVLNPQDQSGNLVVSINLGLQQYDWERAVKLLESQEVTEVAVTGYNKGGILVQWGRLEGFIPFSHLMTMSAEMSSRNRRDAFDDLKGLRLGVKVIEVDQRRRRLIFSEREAQREWRIQQKARLMTDLMEGDVVRGTVTGIRDFGVFVDLGGADGLIHVSELAWHRVEHPNDVMSVGDEIEVYVLDLDREQNRIALSRKRLLPDPWGDAMARYHEGQLVSGVVTNVVDFGAFIVMDDGLEGLLHLSEMGNGGLQEPYSYVKKGDRLPLRISRLEPDKRRVGFTQRGLELEPPAEAGAEASEEVVPEASTEATAEATGEAALAEEEAGSAVAEAAHEATHEVAHVVAGDAEVSEEDKAVDDAGAAEEAEDETDTETYPNDESAL